MNAKAIQYFKNRHVVNYTNEYYLIMSALLKAQGFNSFLKGIPLSESNLMHTRNFLKLFLKKNDKKVVKVKYRGKRLSNPNHTLKSEATHFDVYLNNNY